MKNKEDCDVSDGKLGVARLHISIATARLLGGNLAVAERYWGSCQAVA